MSFVYLVRHAQASFGADNYDQLSALGHTQSRWLGEHFAERGVSFRRVVAGTLVRQQDTARGILEGMGQAGVAIETHAGLNEYSGEALYSAYTGGGDPREGQRGDYRAYWRTFRAAMRAWADGTLEGVPETWDAFGARMRDALAWACADAGRDDAVLLVSSGGAICRALVDLLGAPGHVAIELNLQFRNTAFCELISGSSGLRLVSVNTLPHLETPSRRHAITAT